MKACRTFIPATGKGAITEKVTGRGILVSREHRGTGTGEGCSGVPGVLAVGGRAGGRAGRGKGPRECCWQFHGSGEGPLGVPGALVQVPCGRHAFVGDSRRRHNWVGDT